MKSADYHSGLLLAALAYLEQFSSNARIHGDGAANGSLPASGGRMQVFLLANSALVPKQA